MLRTWLERKKVLDPVWLHLRESLPSHVRDVLGPRKNLLLLREILASAGFEDSALVDDLAKGFPLTGELPRSGTLLAVEYALPAETRDSLLQQLGRRNDDILRRVVAATAADVEVAEEMDRKTADEIEAGKVCEVPLASVMDHCVITPRFPVDEGIKVKKGVERRMVRSIDDFTASLINAAVATGESIHHDTLDVLVALLHLVGADGQSVRFRKDAFVGAYKDITFARGRLGLRSRHLAGC